MKSFSFTTYLSPLTWRYGSEKMRYIFSEENKYKTWRKIWVALARAQHKAGLVSAEELDDLKRHESNVSIERILEIEKTTKHDVVAAIREFAEHAKVGGGKIHLGATSMDIVDNGDAMRIKDALNIVEEKLVELLKIFAKKIEEYADVACIGYTHLQPAEPTTVGYRMSVYAHDLLVDYHVVQFVKQTFKSKGMKGATGTSASYLELLNHPSTPLLGKEGNKRGGLENFENDVMKALDLDAALITTQVYPRKYDYLILTALAGIASSCAKFAADVRILSNPSIGEWSEPFGKGQVGSSAMPFKKNPLDSEKICSLARYVTQLPPVALENASHSYLERTLDDSSNKRIFMPEGFLAVDEILMTSTKVLSGLVVNRDRIKHNLAQYGPFAATESIIIDAVKGGANRQEMHELLRSISLDAWEEIQKGNQNPMENLLTKNEKILKYVSRENIKKLLDVSGHIGDAPERARKLVKIIKKTIDS